MRISWFEITWQGGHVGVNQKHIAPKRGYMLLGQYNGIFCQRIYMAPKRENFFYSWPPAWPPWCHVQTSNNIASNNWSQSTVPPPLPPFLLLPLWQDQTFHQRVALLWWPKHMWVGLELSDHCDLWICLCLLDTGKQAKLATFDFCVLNGFGRKPSLGAPEALLPVIIKHDK